MARALTIRRDVQNGDSLDVERETIRYFQRLFTRVIKMTPSNGRGRARRRGLTHRKRIAGASRDGNCRGDAGCCGSSCGPSGITFRTGLK